MIIKVDINRPEGWDACLREAAVVIQEGGLLVFPTDTFYGLGCDAWNASSLKKIFALKGRSPEKPLLLLIAEAGDLVKLTQNIPPKAKRLMDAHWPGPLTLVLPASEAVPREASAGTGKIGIRMPGCLFTRELIKRAGVPLVGTSANISGEGGAEDIKNIQGDFGEQVQLYLDAGKLSASAPSTVVDLTGDSVVILREGVIPKEEIDFSAI